MQRLFLGIYGAIFVSTMLVLAGAYFALEPFNQYRYKSHLLEVMAGTSHLLRTGIARQHTESRRRWIELAATLMDARITLSPAIKLQAHAPAIRQVPSSIGASERFLIYLKLEQSEQALILEFNGLTEQLVTATAFLMLNELGRYPAEQRQRVFDELTSHFSYPVFRLQIEDLGLDSRQIERLQRGETIVEWNKEFGRGLAIYVYAPWGNTSDVLALGPIAFFDPYPPHIIATVLSSTLLLMAMFVMLIIRRVANRLVQLQHKVDAVSPEYLLGREKQKDPDVITELNLKIQDMTLRIKKLLDEKAYMIRAASHDLRTPISKIHFRLEELSQSLGVEHVMLKGCRNDLKQLNALIDELLTYERLSVEQEIEFRSLDLSALIESQIEGIKAIYPGLSVQLNSFLPAPCWIEGNEILLRRLLENLFNNAGQYAHNRVVVELHWDQFYATVTINDDGDGLEAENIPHLFDPFFRAEASRSSANSGYGMGLAIVKQVAIQHNANLEASNNDWGGARFVLQLPRQQSSDMTGPG